MSLSPLQQQQQASLLNFNQLTVQTTNDSILAPIGYQKSSTTTTSPLNNLLNTTTTTTATTSSPASTVVVSNNDEEMSTSSSASSTHSISSSSNSSIKDEHLLTTLSPMLGIPSQQQQQQQPMTQRNINTLLSSTTLTGSTGLVDLTNPNVPNKCDLCKEMIINNTKLLWGCYHVFCPTCIERLQLTSPNSATTAPTTKSNIISCPLCAQEIRIVDTALPFSNDINDFIPNGSYDFSLFNLLNDNNNKLKQQQQQQQQHQRCQSCKTNDTLIQKCFSCYNQLCQNCLITHQYIHHFDLKEILLDSPLLNQQLNTQDRFTTCLKHKTEQTKYYCSTCNHLLCKECLLYEPHSNPQQKHEFGLITEIGVTQMKKFQQQFDTYKLQFQTLLNNNNDSNNNSLFNHQNHNHHQYHHHTNEDNAAQLLHHLNLKYQKASNDIDTMHQFYKQMLDDRKQELKNELDSIYNTKQMVINNLILASKNDENLNKIKNKIDNIVSYTQKLMKNSSVNSTNLNEFLLSHRIIEQKLPLLLQQLALITNDMNLNNKYNKDLYNIEFIANYSAIQTTFYNTFGYLKYSNLNDGGSMNGNHGGYLLNSNGSSNSSSSNSSSNGYKPKPIGPPTVNNSNNNNNGHRHNSPKLSDFPIIDSYKGGVSSSTTATNTSTGNSNNNFDLLSFESWSNGINSAANSDLSGLLVTNGNDLTLQGHEHMLDLTTSTTNGRSVSGNHHHNGNGNGNNNNNSQVSNTNGHHHHHLQTSLQGSILPARSQLKRQKMIYNCKFGEFGVNDGQFTEPSGVAINQLNDIIVADTNSHRIQIFDRDGHFKFKFGECGKREGQLLYPNRVSIVKQTGDIIVTERSPTHQIQIYNQYGHFIRKFGANILQHPRGVCVDSKGNIIVVECKVMRVIIFDQYGNVVHKFSCSKYLEFPNGVCVNDKQEIFISDNRAHCIKVFNYEGQFLRQIGGEGITNYPIGVGINSNGEVLVADNHNNFNLTVFTQDGQLINALESKVKHAQCFDVGLMDDGSIVLASKDYRIYVYRYISTQSSPNTTTNTTPTTTSTSSNNTSTTTITNTNSTLAY